MASIRRIPSVDLHVHSEHSLDSQVPVWEIVRAGKNRGLAVGVSDHCGPEDPIDTDPRINDYLAALDGFPLYRSLELDLGSGLLVSPGILRRLDYVIGSVHRLPGKDFFDTELSVKNVTGMLDEMMDVILDSLERFPIDILGHPGLLPKSLRNEVSEVISRDWWDRLITEVTRRGVALELSGRWELPPPEIVRAASSRGAFFSLGSDAHQVEKIGALEYPFRLIREFTIPRERIFLPDRRKR